MAIRHENVAEIFFSKLYEKKVFVFDWDGTIFDSMGLKAKNFNQAFQSTVSYKKGSQIQSVEEEYLRLSGKPRKKIFFEIIEIFKEKVENFSFDHFDKIFESLNREKLAHASIFPDAIELITELNKRDYRIFISSSVPQKELLNIVDMILPKSIKDIFISILGSGDSFSKGIDHLTWIANQTRYPFDKLLVIGDNPADYELSLQAGVDCILVNRSGKMVSQAEDNYLIDDLFKIKEFLPDEI
jgi:phosphoglycolate phosphatase-like HAD superfamily hydrolase